MEECSAQRSPRGSDLVALERSPSRVAGKNWPESRFDVEGLDFRVDPLPSLLDLMMRREQMSSDCSPSISDHESVHARADAYIGNADIGLPLAFCTEGMLRHCAFSRFHVFTCRILGERFATLPPSRALVYFFTGVGIQSMFTERVQ